MKPNKESVFRNDFVSGKSFSHSSRHLVVQLYFEAIGKC